MLRGNKEAEISSEAGNEASSEAGAEAFTEAGSGTGVEPVKRPDTEFMQDSMLRWY